MQVRVWFHSPHSLTFENMSSSGLQCIQSVKNRTRTSSTKGLEATAVSHCDLSPPRRKKNSSKNQLYDIEIINQDGSRVKVHYIGYSSEYDEWKPKTEVKYVPPTFESMADKPFSPLKELACSKIATLSLWRSWCTYSSPLWHHFIYHPARVRNPTLSIYWSRLLQIWVHCSPVQWSGQCTWRKVASAGCEWSWGFFICDAGNYFILHDERKTYSGLQCGEGW